MAAFDRSDHVADLRGLHGGRDGGTKRRATERFDGLVIGEQATDVFGQVVLGLFTGDARDVLLDPAGAVGFGDVGDLLGFAGVLGLFLVFVVATARCGRSRDGDLAGDGVVELLLEPGGGGLLGAPLGLSFLERVAREPFLVGRLEEDAANAPFARLVVLLAGRFVGGFDLVGVLLGPRGGVFVGHFDGHLGGVGVDADVLELRAFLLGDLHGVELFVADLDTRGRDLRHLVAQDLAAQEVFEHRLGGAELVAHEDVVLARLEVAVVVGPRGAEDRLEPEHAGGQLLVADTEATFTGVAAHQHGLDELGHHLFALDRRHGTVEWHETEQLVGHAREKQTRLLVAVGGLQAVDTGCAQGRGIGGHAHRQLDIGRGDRLAVDLDENTLLFGARTAGDRPARRVEREDERQDDDAEQGPDDPRAGLLAKCLEHGGCSGNSGVHENCVSPRSWRRLADSSKTRSSSRTRARVAHIGRTLPTGQ